MNKNTPLSAKEYCYRELKESLLSARFLPGEQVTVKSLAERLGLGVMPVREAVQRLVSEGGLTLLPSRLIRVTMLSRCDYKDVAQIRQLLEPLAIEKACQNATEDDKANIKEAWHLLAQAIELQDSDNILQANQVFHFTLYQAAHSQHLLQLINLQWLKTGPMLAEPLVRNNHQRGKERDLHFGKGTYENHKVLCDAVLAGDKNIAVKAITVILRKASEWFLNYYPFED